MIAVEVDEGDAVAGGQRVAAIDARDLELLQAQMRAQLAEARARLDELMAGPRREVIAAARARREELAQRRKLAEAQLERRAELLARQAVSKEEYDVAAFEAGSLRAAEDAAAHQLEELEAGTRREQVLSQRAVLDRLSARLASIELDIEKSELRAPFSGHVSKRMVDEGTVIEPGEAIVAIVEDQAPEARIGMPFDAAETIQPGERHRIEASGGTWEAEVISRLPELDAGTGTVTVLFRLAAGAEDSLYPGQVAKLEMTRELNMAGHWVPAGALAKGVRGLWACYALEGPEPAADGAFRLETRDVEVLYTEEDRALVRGALSTGEMIVASGLNRVSPGQLVRPVAR